MSDKETKERIERDASEYIKQYLPHVNTTGHWLGYIDGAESERPKVWNEAIDACIEILSNAPWDQNVIPLMEQLKHKH